MPNVILFMRIITHINTGNDKENEDKKKFLQRIQNKEEKRRRRRMKKDK